MKRLLLSFVLAAVISLSGCSDEDYPFEAARGDGRAVLASKSTLPVGSTIQFSDDFEAGISPRLWILETVNEAQWVHASQIGAGYIHSQQQEPCHPVNQWTDIIATKSDFTNFVMTWDLRFRTAGWHSGKTAVYFRVDDFFRGLRGYWIQIAVAVTGDPAYYIKIMKNSPWNPFIEITPSITYRWELDRWYSFRLEVRGNSFKIKVWPKGDPEPTDWLIDAVDTDTSWPCTRGRIGFGSFWGTETDADNVVVTSPAHTLQAGLDIKPGSCPNPLNAKMLEKGNADNPRSMKGGVLPVAITGCADLDVHDIDASSVLLEGAAPLRIHYDDVAAGAGSAEPCACNDDGADGFQDLVLHFKKADVIAALGGTPDGSSVQLTITGRLHDGTAFEGSDCVVIIGGADEERLHSGKSERGKRTTVF